MTENVTAINFNEFLPLDDDSALPPDQYSNTRWLQHATMLAALLGMTANLVNFFVFWCEPVRRHYLSVGLRLLSANDFLLLLFFFALSFTQLHNRSQYTCFLTNYLFGLVSMLSPWLLVVITIDRLLFLRAPRGLSGCRKNAQRVCLMIKLAIAASIAWNLHCRWTVGFGQYIGYNNTMMCVPTGLTHARAFQLADTLIVSFLPGFLLLLLNCLILFRVRRLVASIVRGSASRQACNSSSNSNREGVGQDDVAMGMIGTAATTAGTTVGGSNSSGNRSRQQRTADQASAAAAAAAQTQQQPELRKHQCQITRMLMGFCFVYLAFNLPNYLTLCLGQVAFTTLDREMQHIYAHYNLMRLVGQLLYILHFSTNSLIYAYANKLFRTALCNFGSAASDWLFCRKCLPHG